jgi:hypothetical protein
MKNRSYLRSRSRPYISRQIDVREILQRFLIVCEGIKTEPYYFINFRAPTVSVRVVGTGFNTYSLVREAIRLGAEDEYDQIWCVFDRDDNPAQQFRDAIELAGANNIQIAYSNQAFELWYLLHFNYYDTALSRHDYITRLSQLLGHEYQKNSKTIYGELISKQPDAIRNARRLLEQYNPCQPENDDPSTTVHLLVEQLNQFARH